MTDIRTEVWKEPEDHPGFLRYVEQRTLRQVKRDMLAVLDAIYIAEHDCNARDLLEWISGAAPGSDFPKGEPLVTVSHGGSEGWHIVILSRQRKGDAVTVFTIKYLIGREDTWFIAKQLDAAFELN